MCHHYPRRLLSTAASILRGVCHSVCVCVCVCVWACGYVSMIKRKPWSEWFETWQSSSLQHCAEACWFWVQKVKGQGYDVDGTPITAQFLEFLVHVRIPIHHHHDWENKKTLIGLTYHLSLHVISIAWNKVTHKINTVNDQTLLPATNSQQQQMYMQ